MYGVRLIFVKTWLGEVTEPPHNKLDVHMSELDFSQLLSLHCAFNKEVRSQPENLTQSVARSS